MHLVLHAPNAAAGRAWGLALRHSAGVQLQAAATEDAVLLRSPDAQLPVDGCLLSRSSSVREVLTQALLDAPVFPCAGAGTPGALAIPRFRGGRRCRRGSSAWRGRTSSRSSSPISCVPGNIPGEREIPDTPVKGTIHCLERWT